jgi:Protein of unknown function (DUF2723)
VTTANGAGDAQLRVHVHVDVGWSTTLVALLALAVYVLAAAPAPYLLDSAELAAASFGLGVAHPPGEPVALLWGKLFTLLPLGSVAFRVSLSQAVAAAAAVALVYRAALALVASLDSTGVGAIGHWGRQLLAALAALGFGLAPGVVFNANRPEVYALATALSAAALMAAVRADTDDGRPALLAALLVGLGLANHPLVAGLAALGAVLATVPLLRQATGPSRLRLVLGAVAATVAGLLVLAYLPARSLALYAPGAPVDTIVWGDGRTAAGLWWILSARTFAGKNVIVQGNADPAALPFVLLEEIGPLLVLGLVGAGLALRARASRRPALGGTVLAAGAMLGALAAGLDPSNPDIRGYLAPALAALAVFGAGALALLLGFLRRPRLAAAGAASMLLITTTIALSRVPAVSLNATEAADADVSRLQGTVPRAVLATGHFETASLVAYQRLVEGRRPDTDWVHLGFAGGPGYASRLAAARPALGPLLAAHAAGALDAATVQMLGRPVRFEAHNQLPASLREQLEPAGRLWALPGEGIGLSRLSEAVFAEAARDRQVRGYFAWRAYQDALLACHRLPEVTGTRLGELERLVPEDRRLQALRLQCDERR